jgi:glycosyltransferase involved in cell wall biosynthesis
MKILSISLDKKILDKNSQVALRMKEYGQKDELFIMIPSLKGEDFSLSKTVRVYPSSGQSKLQQYRNLKKLGKKLIEENNIELITTQDPFFTGRIGVWLKKKTKVKLEVQVHGDFFDSNYYSNRIINFISRKVIKKADKIRTVGQRIKESLLKLGIDEKKIIVKPIKLINHLDQSDGYVDLKKNHPKFEKYFVFVGRLVPVKNIEWLIGIFLEVVKEKQNYGLFIIGDGFLRGKLEKLVHGLGLENNIIFTGWMTYPPSSMKSADCVLFPSLSEGCGLVSMEAQAAGVPVIMNDVGVANYELKPSEKVKILPINDKQKWIKAILEV